MKTYALMTSDLSAPALVFKSSSQEKAKEIMFEHVLKMAFPPHSFTLLQKRKGWPKIIHVSIMDINYFKTDLPGPSLH